MKHTPRYGKKKRLGTNFDITNATYETADARTKLQQRYRLGMVSRKTTVCERECYIIFTRANHLYLILMQLRITNTCLVCIEVLYFISETHIIMNNMMKQSKGPTGDLKLEQKKAEIGPRWT